MSIELNHIINPARSKWASASTPPTTSRSRSPQTTRSSRSPMPGDLGTAGMRWLWAMVAGRQRAGGSLPTDQRDSDHASTPELQLRGKDTLDLRPARCSGLRFGARQANRQRSIGHLRADLASHPDVLNHAE
jgi:hypothetical protein